jgi:hypothetical protein
MKLHNRGGYRGPTAHRPLKYGEPTKTVRIPLSRIPEVRAYLAGTADKLASVQDLASRWRELTAGRETSPRWQKAAELVRELSTVLQASQEATGAANGSGAHES